MSGRTRRSGRFFLPLTPERTFGVLLALLAAIFLMGGGSRADIESLAVLRPLALLAAAVGVAGLGRGALRDYRVPFLLLAALALLMAVQLIPLPPALWTHLPLREAIARLDDAVGLSGIWRPLSLSPMRTANSLASLAVPLAVLVLYCQLGERRRRDVLVALVGIAVASALLGFFQLLAGRDSGLYFYEITHRGDAVGFFANRNHQSAFLAASMLIAVHLAMERGRAAGRGMFTILAFAAAAVLFAGVLSNVSRGGLLSGAVALVLVPLVIPARVPAEGGGRRRRLSTGLLVLPVLGIFALFALSQRSPALSRLFTGDTIEDLRVQILPVLLDMTRGYQPWGAGFGAFEQAYRMAEPAALLVPNYFNNAHNDWLQFAIEGGVVALLIAVALAVVLAFRLVRLMRAGDLRADPRISRAWLGFAVLATFGFASLFDYPLRVPSLMGMAFIALSELFAPLLRKSGEKDCDPKV